jgi:hypothetical protein
LGPDSIRLVLKEEHNDIEPSSRGANEYRRYLPSVRRCTWYLTLPCTFVHFHPKNIVSKRPAYSSIINPRSQHTAFEPHHSRSLTTTPSPKPAWCPYMIIRGVMTQKPSLSTGLDAKITTRPSSWDLGSPSRMHEADLVQLSLKLTSETKLLRKLFT